MATLCLLIATTIALVVVLPSIRSRSLDGPASEASARLVFGFAGLVLIAVGASLSWRRMRRLGGMRNPMLVLDRAQRRDLLAQVRGLRPADPALLPLTRNIAGRLTGQRWLVLTIVGVWLSLLGQWISRPTSWTAVMTTGTAILIAVVRVLSERDVRRARRFLAVHG